MAKTWMPETLPIFKEVEVLDQDDFLFFRDEIRKLSGIRLVDTKRDLVQTRLRAHMETLGKATFAVYRRHLDSLSRDHKEWQQFINCLTTNKTDWFREPKHFDYLIEKLIPAWSAQRRKRISVWSAACSTGEEPYTTAMVLHRHLPPPLSFELVGSDIDTEVLKIAQNGVYPMSKLADVPEEYFAASLSRGSGAIADWARIRPEIKSRVSFRHLNLLGGEHPWREKFDLILCRNVLIYFPKDVIERVIEGLYQTAAPGCVLFIGHSESLQNLKVSWNYLGPSIFVKGRL